MSATGWSGASSIAGLTQCAWRRALERDRHQLLAAHACADDLVDRGLHRRVEVADRIETNDALRAQRAIEQIPHALAFRRWLRQAIEAEMPRHQLIGLEHALALAHGQHAAIERKLQRAL